MFERLHEPVLSRAAFARRVARFLLLDLIIIMAALLLGIFGYHYFEDLGWVDATLNASMILGGMGPVNPLHTTAGKLFASFYALFSGLLFIGLAGLLFTPFAHRLLHQFHIAPGEDENDAQPEADEKG
jgi:TRAP-type C4-dicarboxylate transport system permease small subunit